MNMERVLTAAGVVALWFIYGFLCFGLYRLGAVAA